MCRKWRGDARVEEEEREAKLSCWTRWFAGLKASSAALFCPLFPFISFGVSPFFLLLLLLLAASLKDNNINAGNLNGRAQWMKFANIFQKLNFSGKFFCLRRLSGKDNDGRPDGWMWSEGNGRGGVVKDCRLAVYENKWRKLIWSTLKCKNA